MNARIERLKELLKQSPKDAFVRFALAKEMEKANEPQKAIEFLTQLLADEPEYVGAYYHLAVLYQNAEEIDKAFEAYDEGIRIAESLNDNHALSELKNARLNLEIEH